MAVPEILGKDKRIWLRPDEINEAPGECVVSACLIPNEECEPNRKMVSCPFDPAHKMKQSKFATHVVKCEKQHPHIKKVRCLYNTLEYIDQDKIAEHEEKCTYKYRFQLMTSLTLNTTAQNTSQVESHLTTWEENLAENRAVPTVTSPSVQRNDEKVIMKSFGFHLRKTIAMENDLTSSLDSGGTSRVHQESEDKNVQLEENIGSDSEEFANDTDSSFSGDDYLNLDDSPDDNEDNFCDSDEINLWSSTSSLQSGVQNDGLVDLMAGDIFDSHDKNDEFEEEPMNYDLYNSVDFSQTCSPQVHNAVEHRMIHSEDLFIGNARPTPSVVEEVEEKGTNSDSNGSVMGDAGGIDKSNKTITEVSPREQTYVKHTINSTSNSSDSHDPVPNNPLSGQQSDNHSFPGPKSRCKMSLSDLTEFPDKEEPSPPVILSSSKGQATPHKIENNNITPWVQSTYKGNRYVYESSQSSDGDTIYSDDQTASGHKQNSTPGVNPFQPSQGNSRGRGHVFEHSSFVRNNGHVGSQYDRYDNEPCNRGFPPPYMSDAGNHVDPISRSCNVPQFNMGRGESPYNRGRVMTGRGIPLTNRNQAQSPGIPTASKSVSQRGGRGQFNKNLRERVLKSRGHQIENEQTSSHVPNSPHIPHGLRGQTPPHFSQRGRVQTSPHGLRGQTLSHAPTSPHGLRGQTTPHGPRGQTSLHGRRGQISHHEERERTPPHVPSPHHVPQEPRGQTHAPTSHHNPQGGRRQTSPRVPQGLRGQSPPRIRGRGEILKELLLSKRAGNQQNTS